MPRFANACGVCVLVAVVGCSTEAARVGQVEQAVSSGGVVINEVESNGGVPGDWIELYNPTGATVDVSGWKILDNDNAHTPYVIPTGTSIVATGFLVVDEAQFGFGLGASDSA